MGNTWLDRWGRWVLWLIAVGAAVYVGLWIFGFRYPKFSGASPDAPGVEAKQRSAPSEGVKRGARTAKAPAPLPWDRATEEAREEEVDESDVLL